MCVKKIIVRYLRYVWIIISEIKRDILKKNKLITEQVPNRFLLIYLCKKYPEVLYSTAELAQLIKADKKSRDKCDISEKHERDTDDWFSFYAEAVFIFFFFFREDMYYWSVAFAYLAVITVTLYYNPAIFCRPFAA